MYGGGLPWLHAGPKSGSIPVQAPGGGTIEVSGLLPAWYQMDLGSVQHTIGVSIKGNCAYAGYVKDFNVTASADGSTFSDRKGRMRVGVGDPVPDGIHPGSTVRGDR